MNASTTLARTIVRQIVEAGITDVVISPGSRNAPLSVAFYQAAAKNLITLHIRIDERTAAFFALGIAKATKRPVPIVCTSGTAVANYHPAVLEASHSNLPLMVITADRPAELRRTGANQTTEQARIFGKAVRYFADISGVAYPLELPLHSLQNGPVHLNVQFSEPLTADGEDSWLDAIKIATPRIFDRKIPGIFRSQSKRGVLVIGHDRAGFDRDQIREFAQKLTWPVISEDPLLIADAISHASLFLTSEAVAKEVTPDTVVVIGRTTLSRPINKFIKSANREIVIDPRMETVDSDRAAQQRFLALPDLDVTACDEAYRARLEKYSHRTAKMISEISQWSEALVARDIAASLASNSTLFISSSRPVRDIEAFASSRSDIETFANRGLAGIDGNISTALGIASQRNQTIAVLGDLSFLHDLTGLIHHEKINCRFIVIDNNGGGIFSTLSHRGVEGFETIFGTPHNLDIAAIAASFGIPTSTISTQKELSAELSKPINGISLIVVKVPDREENAEHLQAIARSIDSI